MVRNPRHAPVPLLPPALAVGSVRTQLLEDAIRQAQSRRDLRGIDPERLLVELPAQYRAPGRHSPGQLRCRRSPLRRLREHPPEQITVLRPSRGLPHRRADQRGVVDNRQPQLQHRLRHCAARGQDLREQQVRPAIRRCALERALEVRHRVLVTHPPRPLRRHQREVRFRGVAKDRCTEHRMVRFAPHGGVLRHREERLSIDERSLRPEGEGKRPDRRADRGEQRRLPWSTRAVGGLHLAARSLGVAPERPQQQRYGHCHGRQLEAEVQEVVRHDQHDSHPGAGHQQTLVRSHRARAQRPHHRQPRAGPHHEPPLGDPLDDEVLRMGVRRVSRDAIERRKHRLESPPADSEPGVLLDQRPAPREHRQLAEILVEQLLHLHGGDPEDREHPADPDRRQSQQPRRPLECAAVVASPVVRSKPGEPAEPDRQQRDRAARRARHRAPDQQHHPERCEPGRNHRLAHEHQAEPAHRPQIQIRREVIGIQERANVPRLEGVVRLIDPEDLLEAEQTVRDRHQRARQGAREYQAHPEHRPATLGDRAAGEHHAEVANALQHLDPRRPRVEGECRPPGRRLAQCVERVQPDLAVGRRDRTHPGQRHRDGLQSRPDDQPDCHPHCQAQRRVDPAWNPGPDRERSPGDRKRRHNQQHRDVHGPHRERRPRNQQPQDRHQPRLCAQAERAASNPFPGPAPWLRGRLGIDRCFVFGGRCHDSLSPRSRRIGVRVRTVRQTRSACAGTIRLSDTGSVRRSQLIPISRT